MVTPTIDISNIDTARSYTVKEVSRLLQYTPTYIRDLCRAGKIKGNKPMGGHIRIPGTEVQRLATGVNTGNGISTAAADDDVDDIEVSEAVAAKVLPNKADSGSQTVNVSQDEDDGTGGAFRHLFGSKE